MSVAITIIEFMQNIALEDEEINNLFKDIDKINYETKQKSNQIEGMS